MAALPPSLDFARGVYTTITSITEPSSGGTEPSSCGSFGVLGLMGDAGGGASSGPANGGSDDSSIWRMAYLPSPTVLIVYTASGVRTVPTTTLPFTTRVIVPNSTPASPPHIA